MCLVETIPFSKLNIPVKSETKTVFVEAIPLIQDAETNKHIIYDNFDDILTPKMVMPIGGD